MVTRRIIGTNPLDAVIPAPAASVPPLPVAPAPVVVKEHLTVHVPVDLIERVKNAVYWTPGLTLAQLAEEALRQAIDAREAVRGTPFLPRERPLTVGRPLR